MSNTVIRQTETTTTTVTAQPTEGRIRFDPAYFKTLPGILKVVQTIVAIITFICATLAHGPNRPETVTPFRPGHAAWGAFISFLSIFLTLAWLLFHVLHVKDLAPRLPWPIFEAIYYALWAFFFFISGAVLAALSHDAEHAYVYDHYLNYYYDYNVSIRSAAGAGAFFAFAATVLFAFNVFLLLRAWREQRLSQRTSTIHTVLAA